MDDLFSEKKDSWDSVIVLESEDAEFEFQNFTVHFENGNWYLEAYSAGDSPEMLRVLLEGSLDGLERVFSPEDELFLMSEFRIVFRVENLEILKKQIGE